MKINRANKSKIMRVLKLNEHDVQIVIDCCSLDGDLLKKWEAWAETKPTFDTRRHADMRYRTSKVDLALDIIDLVLGTHGVEAVQDERISNGSYYLNVGALYCNMGDTYDATVLYDVAAESFTVTSWGDWYEAWEAEQEEGEE